MAPKYLMTILINLSNSEFKDLCENIKKGVPISTPVFDGAKEHDVTKMLGACKFT